MNGVNVQNANGETININVVRYFKLNNFDYLVFSLNEIDDGGYVKLYISKIMNGVGTTITDDVEWNLVKDTIKDIIKRNKEGLPTGIDDLSELNVSQLRIIDQKVFKLNDSLLNLLSQNKNVVESPIEQNNIQTQNLDEISLDEIPETPTISNSNDFVTQSNNINTIVNQVEVNSTPVPEEYNVAISDSDTKQSDVIEEQKLNSDLYYVGDTNIPTNTQLEPANDYKLMYEELLKRNTELSNELKKYQNLIESLKEVLK